MKIEAEFSGLTQKEVATNLQQYGPNILVPEKKSKLWQKILEVMSEPMFLLLLAACLIYFFLGEPRDGIIMLFFVFFIVVIDVIQEWKTDKTLEALKDLSAPQVRVIRENMEITIPASEIVPDDLMLISEGEKIAADGVALTNDDLVVDESSLTGESIPIIKLRETKVFAGTVVTTGSAIVRVSKTGGETEYGKIGLQVAAAPIMTTPLQKQINTLIKYSAIVGAFLLIIVAIVTWFNATSLFWQDRLVQSILAGITLAMAIIPEEFPVILTVFLSMGAWRMARKQALMRRLGAIETLGAMSVLCTDKTGTLTENQMKVEEVFLWQKDVEKAKQDFLETLGLACEKRTYDPMEKAMLQYIATSQKTDLNLDLGELDDESNKLIKDYPFSNETKRMGHLWKVKEKDFFLAVKGSPESVMELCQLTKKEKELIIEEQNLLAKKAYRVIGVACWKTKKSFFAAELSDCENLQFLGLIALADPPREAAAKAIELAKKAGVRVIMITGDNGLTAKAIAEKIGIESPGGFLTGAEMNNLSDNELKMQLEKQVNVFARVVPADKLRIVKALKNLGKITGMIGDGVNDAPALKYADIGIAMGGNRGTQVAREAADMVILDDDFATIISAIRDGRRIYDNIKKSVAYVFVLHIPILLSALVAPILKINPALVMLLPLQVVLSELIVDPICSVVLERQKAEPGIMRRKPRDPNKFLFDWGQGIKILLQGLILFLTSFGLYFLILTKMGNAELGRTMGVLTLSLASLFLVYVNSNEHLPAWKIFIDNVKDKIIWLINGGIVVMLLLVIYVPNLNTMAKFVSLTVNQFLVCLGLAAGAAFWFDLVKFVRQKREMKENESN